MRIYIHIPYCDSKCHYCSFNSYVDKFDTRKNYMLAIETQLKNNLKKFKVQKITSIFIGGGTPSTVSPKLYEPIFNILNPLIKENIEITIEANPNSATEEWLEGIFNLGVNRISFGVQSFNDKKLKNLNRTHNKNEAINSIISAEKIGFKNLSLDLIYNYIGDTKDSLKDDINIAFSLPINHISAYELTIEPKTHFSLTPKVKQNNDELAFFVSDEVQKRGFNQYEISNFGTYESKHNKGYWNLDNYLGIGAGAVGFNENIRFYPEKNIDLYIKNPLGYEEEILSKNDLITEKILLGLRSNIGISVNDIDSKTVEIANFLVEEKKLIKKNNRYFNSNFFISDEIALFLIN